MAPVKVTSLLLVENISSENITDSMVHWFVLFFLFEELSDLRNGRSKLLLDLYMFTDPSWQLADDTWTRVTENNSRVINSFPY